MKKQDFKKGMGDNPIGKIPLPKKNYETQIVEAVAGNHMWLNAFSCINPTAKFKLELAEAILEWLNQEERLIRKDDPIGRLTPILYMSINKS